MPDPEILLPSETSLAPFLPLFFLFLNFLASMASLCLNSLPLPSQKLTETASLSNSTPTGSKFRSLVVSGNPPTFVSAPGRRIVAVGDLHGDFQKTRSALEIAGVLSCNGENLWVGGDTVLVQLGDVLDRGEDEIAILSLLRSLDVQAKVEGGAVFQVNGNHETMNVEGDFRYVEPGAFDECASFLEYLETCDYDWEKAFVCWSNVSKDWKDNQKRSRNYWDSLNLVKQVTFLTDKDIQTLGQRQKGVIARSILFRPGGPMACELARYPVVLKVNDWIFCHGSLLTHHVTYGIERMNMEVARWMRGINDSEGDGLDGSDQIPFMATRGYDSVVWSRLYSRDLFDLNDYQISQMPKQINDILEDTLQAVGAKGMVVGHTPQVSGVNCEYNCSVWRIDVGMSSGVLDSRPEVLEIQDGKVRVIRSKRPGRSSELQVVDYT